MSRQAWARALRLPSLRPAESRLGPHSLARGSALRVCSREAAPHSPPTALRTTGRVPAHADVAIFASGPTAYQVSRPVGASEVAEGVHTLAKIFAAVRSEFRGSDALHELGLGLDVHLSWGIGLALYAAVARSLLVALSTACCAGLRAAHAVPGTRRLALLFDDSGQAVFLVGLAERAATQIGHEGAAKAEVCALITRFGPIAKAGMHPLLEAPAPAAAAIHLRVAGFRRPRIGRVPIIGPFPHVAADVEQAERAGGIRLSGTGIALFPTGVTIRARQTPGVFEILLAAAGGVLPLDLAREARVARRAESVCLVPSHAIDRVRWAVAVRGIAMRMRCHRRRAPTARYAVRVGRHRDLRSIDAERRQLGAKPGALVLGIVFTGRRSDPKGASGQQGHAGRTGESRRTGSGSRRTGSGSRRTGSGSRRTGSGSRRTGRRAHGGDRRSRRRRSFLGTGRELAYGQN